jgi:hypothetical protein
MKAVRKAQLSDRPPRRTNILDFDALSGPSPINRRPPLSPDDSPRQPAAIAEATFQRCIDAAAALHYAVLARYQTAAAGTRVFPLPIPNVSQPLANTDIFWRQKETAWATLNSPKVRINMTTQQQPFNLNINSYIIWIIIFMMIP